MPDASAHSAPRSLMGVESIRIEIRPDHNRLDVYSMVGNRNEIERMTQSWGKVVVDRTEELSSWVDFCYQIMKRGVLVYAYANNHFQGHGPATIAQFIKLWSSKDLPTIGTRVSNSKQTRLFE